MDGASGMAHVVTFKRREENNLTQEPAVVVQVSGLEANLKAVLVRVDCPGQPGDEAVVGPEDVHDRVNACLEQSGVDTVIVVAPDTLPADDETLKLVLNGLTR